MKIPMKSAHDAMRGKKLLNNANIRCNVGKESGKDGCYYYLNVSDRYHTSTMAILNKADFF